MKTHNFTCSRCHEDKEHVSDTTTGYGTNKAGEKICFACCAIVDREQMDKEGKAVLYLSQDSKVWRVTNWPGSLSLPVLSHTKGKHNLAGVRYDVWFRDRTGALWHGTQYGDDTMICHCKRIKG